jgi:pimeloyl-ACP methyl ester carboxylesterase
MTLRDIDGRVKPVVLINATGIRPDRPDQVTGIRTLAPTEIGKLSFHNPALPSPATMTHEQRAGMAANQQAMAVYGGEDFFFAPKLRRLHRVTAPVLVAWGEEDGIFPADYGRAYIAVSSRRAFADRKTGANVCRRPYAHPQPNQTILCWRKALRPTPSDCPGYQ